MIYNKGILSNLARKMLADPIASKQLQDAMFKRGDGKIHFENAVYRIEYRPRERYEKDNYLVCCWAYILSSFRRYW